MNKKGFLGFFAFVIISFIVGIGLTDMYNSRESIENYLRNIPPIYSVLAIGLCLFMIILFKGSEKKFRENVGF